MRVCLWVQLWSNNKTHIMATVPCVIISIHRPDQINKPKQTWTIPLCSIINRCMLLKSIITNIWSIISSERQTKPTSCLTDCTSHLQLNTHVSSVCGKLANQPSTLGRGVVPAYRWASKVRSAPQPCSNARCQLRAGAVSTSEAAGAPRTQRHGGGSPASTKKSLSKRDKTQARGKYSLSRCRSPIGRKDQVKRAGWRELPKYWKCSGEEGLRIWWLGSKIKKQVVFIGLKP